MKREDFYIQEATKYSQSETLNAEALAFIAGMKMADSHPNWIKVEDRLPECIFDDRETMHYSRSVLVAMRWINGCSSYWAIRIAYYDKILDQWLDHNEVPYEGVEYWMPIVLPIEEDEE